MNLLVILVVLIILSVFLFVFHRMNKDKIGDEDFSSIFWILVLYSKRLSLVLNVAIILMTVYWVYAILIVV